MVVHGLGWGRVVGLLEWCEVIPGCLMFLQNIGSDLLQYMVSHLEGSYLHYCYCDGVMMIGLDPYHRMPCCCAMNGCLLSNVPFVIPNLCNITLDQGSPNFSKRGPH
jgi:hypothetical protein